jgi:hypothetical protein
MPELTKLQKEVIATLKKRDRHFVADTLERSWTEGQAGYVDLRVNIGKGLRPKIKHINAQIRAASK